MGKPSGLNAENLTGFERRAAVSLSLVFFLRMSGLFMVLPVLALFSDAYAGVTPTLLGLALGVHGLSQGLLQIPFGLLSDRLGRKPIIIAGLMLFVLGSAIAALSVDIWSLILGRALQGSGAIAAAMMALAADLTREEHRTKTMAIIGMSIGSSFLIALLLGPVIAHWVGLSGIFWITAMMGLVAIAVVIYQVPTPTRSSLHRDAQAIPAQFMQVLKDTQLLRLDWGIFALHMIMTASFLLFPTMIRTQLGLETVNHWWVYLPVLLLAVAIMIPFIVLAERGQRLKPIYLGAIGAVVLSQLGFFLWGNHSALLFLGTLLLYFTAFNLLEASLPSLVSKMAPAHSKGTAMGFYSSSQYLGIFCGGLFSGFLLQQFGPSGVFLACGLLAGLWLVAAYSMKPPRYLKSYLMKVGDVDETEAREISDYLSRFHGVVEVVVVAADGVAYLKVDRKDVDFSSLHEYLDDRLLASSSANA